MKTERSLGFHFLFTPFPENCLILCQLSKVHHDFHNWISIPHLHVRIMKNDCEDANLSESSVSTTSFLFFMKLALLSITTNSFLF